MRSDPKNEVVELVRIMANQLPQIQGEIWRDTPECVRKNYLPKLRKAQALIDELWQQEVNRGKPSL